MTCLLTQLTPGHSLCTDISKGLPSTSHSQELQGKKGMLLKPVVILVTTFSPYLLLLTIETTTYLLYLLTIKTTTTYFTIKISIDPIISLTSPPPSCTLIDLPSTLPLHHFLPPLPHSLISSLRRLPIFHCSPLTPKVTPLSLGSIKGAARQGPPP